MSGEKPSQNCKNEPAIVPDSLDDELDQHIVHRTNVEHMVDGLRFAPLIRVSTESQEKKGESLRTQKKQIIAYVESLGGVIPQDCWLYSGQEHATVGEERKKLDRLLSDAGSGLFDAVIVCDSSRWSRDNYRSKKGLDVLRRNNIKFFVGTTEYNLRSPEHRLFLGMSTEMNEFFALEQARKSIINRIERAKRGIPTGGKLPYGRTFQNGSWGLDNKKARKIKLAAEEYLNGAGIENIAKAMTMNTSNLWKILNKRSGDVWEIRFNSKRLGISEKVSMKIPRLLSDETILAIHERGSSNKTYTHGQIKHEYLLSRMIFCAHCGHAMFGQTNHGKRRYYRHPRGTIRQCDPSFWIPADNIEKAVLVHVFKMYGDVTGIEEAIQSAFPNKGEIEGLETKKVHCEQELRGVRRQTQRVVNAISEGTLKASEARHKMHELRAREAYLAGEICKLDSRIATVPSQQYVKERALAAKRMIAMRHSGYTRLSEMSFEERRSLFAHVFAGRDAEGKRFGVYVERSTSQEEPWNYSIRGGIFEQTGTAPMPLSDMHYFLEVDPEAGDDFDPTLGEGSSSKTRFSLS